MQKILANIELATTDITAYGTFVGPRLDTFYACITAAELEVDKYLTKYAIVNF